MKQLNQSIPTLALDRTDLAILQLLTLNSRTPHAIMAESLKLSPQTVSHRILNLEKSGVIVTYCTIFDLRPLGFARHHVLLRFSSKGKDLSAICGALAKVPSAVWVSSYIGAFDAQVIVDSHDKLPLSTILQQIFTVCGDPLLQYEVFSDIDDLGFTLTLPSFNQKLPIRYRDDGSFALKLAHRDFPAPLKVSSVSISELDLRLIQVLARNPRISLVEIAAELDCDRQTASRRINQLIDKKIILSFNTLVDHQVLGFTGYHLLFRLQPRCEDATLRRALNAAHGLFYAGTSYGAYDLSTYFYAQSPQSLGLTMQNIRSAFGSHILRMDLLIFDRVYHWQQFTPAATEALKTQFSKI